MDECLVLIKKLGCHGLEISPSMIWSEPEKASIVEVSAFKAKLDKLGLCVPSMHSLTFPRPDLTFFNGKRKSDELIEYLSSLARLANQLECPVMVFGSAKARAMGGRDKEWCFSRLREVFTILAEKVKVYGVTLLIEPLSRLETDAINTAEEAMQIIETVGHPNLKLHIDLKSSFAEREDLMRIWTKYVSAIKHCHVSNPNMEAPSESCREHELAAKAIRKSGYDAFISIEMRRREKENAPVVNRAVSFVQKMYLN